MSRFQSYLSPFSGSVSQIFPNQTFPKLICTLTIALCLLPCHSLASTGTRYVQLRHQPGFDARLNYATVQQEASKYAGRIIELSGSIGGIAEGPAGISFMLNMADGNAPTLNLPSSETDILRDSSTPRIRVLARIGEGGGGNVVPLTVLAVALESDVQMLERQAKQKDMIAARREELARQEKSRWQDQANRSAARASSPSRSSTSNSNARSNNRSAPVPDFSGGLGPRVRDWYRAYANFIYHHNPKLGLNMAGQIAFYLLKFSDQHNVDPRLVTAMIVAESDFDPSTTSHAGAMGLGQLMPDEIRNLGLNNAYDIRQNLYGSIANLRTDLNTFANMGSNDGSLSIDQIKLAMATYNAGLGAVKKYKGVPPYRETQGYVKRVIRLYREFCGLPPE